MIIGGRERIYMLLVRGGVGYSGEEEGKGQRRKKTRKKQEEQRKSC